MSNERRLQLFDNTRISSFKTCARKFLYEHVYHWRPDEKSVALTFGSSWHTAMDSVYSNAERLRTPSKTTKREVVDEAHAAFIEEWSKAMPPPEEMSPDDLENLAPRTPHVARELLFGYLDAREHIFSDPAFKVIAIEKPFAVPLAPDDPTLFYVGRLDKVVEYRKQVLVFEHKSSSAFKKGGPFRSDWVDSFNVSSQIDGYIYALRVEFGDRAAGVWIDGTLVHKSEHTNAFKFLPESRSDEQLDSWLWESMNWLDQIAGNLAALAERADPDVPYMAAFPRNTNSCVQYGRCPWLDVCRVIANPAKLSEPPMGYHMEKWSPFDELKLQELGFDIGSTTEPLKGEQP